MTLFGAESEEQERYRDPRLRRPEKQLAGVRLHLLTAFGAFVAVVVQVKNPDAHRELHVPATPQQYTVTVAHAPARDMTLVAVGIRTVSEKKRKIVTPDVIIPVKAVHAHEVTVEALARPVAELRHRSPVDQLLIVRVAALKVERVVAPRNLQRPTRGQADLHTEIRRARDAPVEKVRLHGEPVLSLQTAHARQQHKRQNRDHVQFLHRINVLCG